MGRRTPARWHLPTTSNWVSAWWNSLHTYADASFIIIWCHNYHSCIFNGVAVKPLIHLLHITKLGSWKMKDNKVCSPVRIWFIFIFLYISIRKSCLKIILSPASVGSMLPETFNLYILMSIHLFAWKRQLCHVWIVLLCLVNMYCFKWHSLLFGFQRHSKQNVTVVLCFLTNLKIPVLNLIC